MIFEENASTYFIAKWNETVKEFLCAVHNTNECQVQTVQWRS